MNEDQHATGARSGTSRAYGCCVALAFPLAVLIAFGGACAAIGEVKGEREIGLYIITFPLLGVVTLISAIVLWSAWRSNRIRKS